MPEGKEQSRFRTLKAENSGLVELPEISYAEHLIEFIFEIGMGEDGLSWESIESWSNMTGIKPSFWELSAMRELAAAYVVQYRKSCKVDSPPPYIDLQACRKNVDKKVRSFFG